MVDGNFIRQCLRTEASERKILVVGDSFAEILLRHVALISEMTGYRMKAIFGYFCPFPFAYREIKASTRDACGPVDEVLLQNEIVDSLNPGDIVLARIDFQYSHHRGKALPDADVYDAAIDAFARRVRQKQARLLVIGANPELNLDQMLQLPGYWRWLKFDWTENRFMDENNNRETNYFHVVDDHLSSRFAGSDGVTYFSLKPYFCDAQRRCQFVANGKPLYADVNHLSPAALDAISAPLLETIRGISTPSQ